MRYFITLFRSFIGDDHHFSALRQCPIVTEGTYIRLFFFFYSNSGGGESISLGFLLTFFGVTPREIIVGVNKHRTRYVSGVCRHSIYNIYRTIYLYIIYKCISCISKRSELLNLQSHKGTSTATVLNIPKYILLFENAE